MYVFKCWAHLDGHEPIVLSSRIDYNGDKPALAAFDALEKRFGDGNVTLYREETNQEFVAGSLDLF
jgi:hypothetical protein